MAGVNSLAPAQVAAIVAVRWWMFANRMRTRRGKLEAASRVIVLAFFLLVGFAPAIGLAFGARHAITSRNPTLLATFLWLIFFAWQFLPTLVIAFTESWDTTRLLRFPVGFKTYSLVWILYGSLEPATVVALLWLLAVFLGVAFAAPALALWAALVLLLFGVMNLLLSRLIVAWLARWLAQKRTREIVGVLFILLAISNQLAIRLVARYLPHYLHSPLAERLSHASHLLPPGLAADAIASLHASHFSSAISAIAALCLYAAVFAFLLAIRLRAEYLGENLSEAAPRERAAEPEEASRPGIERYGIPGPVAAVFEKELRVLFRSTQLIVTVVLVPPLVLLVFGKFGASAALGSSPDLGLAFGLANAVLALTRIIYNNLGAEDAGVQFYYVAPVRFRQIALGKNLAHGVILCLQCALVVTAVLLMFGVPSLPGAGLAFSALLFAVLVNVTAGNMFTFIFPKKDDYSMNRKSGSPASGLAAMGVQFGVMLIATPVFVIARHRGVPEEGALFFVLAAVFALAFYEAVLNRLDRLALKRRETLIAELCHTS